LGVVIARKYTAPSAPGRPVIFMTERVTPKNEGYVADGSYLGDQWRGVGGLAGFEAAIEQGPGLFLAAVGIIIAAAAAVFAILWYFTAPRFAGIAEALPRTVLFGGGVLFLYVALEYAGIVATTYSGRPLLLPLGRSTRAVMKLVAPARRLAGLFGSSKDRMAHSAVQVSNAITRATRKEAGEAGPVLVLLPRCLQRPECAQPIVEDIDSCRRCGKCPVADLLGLRNEFEGVIMAVLTGGSVVPAAVSHFKPRAVIGVACERELITGIYVVGDRPVIGVANQRPLGPCRATTLDMAELRAEIEAFLAKG
jgi:hypothetical protein